MGLKARKPNQERIREPRGEQNSYALFDRIDGSHPWRNAAPEAYVDYLVWQRRDGRVAYFNFELAKEIGLIHRDHEHEITPVLEKKLLEIFALQIVNEWDQKYETEIPKKQLKPNRYMATRYLQLQHASKVGRTSGDGRSIWNGTIEVNGTAWDFSSCGTGVTCLSPGAVQAGKPIKTGSGSYSYGSGRAGLDEGVSGAILSEFLHRLGIETERTLVVIEFPGATSVNVRAAKNLIRPSHLFGPLKQENHGLVCGALDYFIQRQNKNSDWQVDAKSPKRYEQLLSILAHRYAEFSAQLEDSYIFCWMDWDGDNMLANGGIIDYGSVRLFGIRHDSYRYDDDERWSTNLNEQKTKARYIVQTLAQLISFAQTGTREPIEKFRTHRALREFEKKFQAVRDRLFLRRLGFTAEQISQLSGRHFRIWKQFEREYRWFEQRKSHTGMRKTGDGKNHAAIYAIREAIVELPRFLAAHNEIMDPRKFMETIRTAYCTKADLKLRRGLRVRIQRFQSAYRQLIRKLASDTSREKRLYLELAMRASQRNLRTPVTGDGVLFVTDKILRLRHRLDGKDLHALIENFIRETARALYSYSGPPPRLSARARKALDDMLDIVEENRHSI